ncbi:MAG: sulfite exporter TauE/SafE family protein [Cytophagales bacterium]|nr:sulfite exporter TauE/SafE family protein [Cytophagales bacterium]
MAEEIVNNFNKAIAQQVTDIDALEQQPVSKLANYRLIDRINRFNARNPKIRWIVISLVLVLAGLYLAMYLLENSENQNYRELAQSIKDFINPDLFQFILIGFAAQIVDGALGMAYGATCTSSLLSVGLSPAMASASVHIAEIFTTGASGLSHLKFKNVNKKLFLYLVIPGVCGAILGAYIISDLIDGKYIKPFMALYLMILGVVIMRKAFINIRKKEKTKNIGILALFGGFMDAIGGGGWGPIVTSTLLSKGREANYTIGSVNMAEFFIALAGAGTFMIFIKISGWQTIAGLIIGGVIAAPFAAYLVSKVKRKTIMITVSLLIIALSIRTLLMTDLQELAKNIQGLF